MVSERQRLGIQFLVWNPLATFEVPGGAPAASEGSFIHAAADQEEGCLYSQFPGMRLTRWVIHQTYGEEDTGENKGQDDR
jgi:hypothetical protein